MNREIIEARAKVDEIIAIFSAPLAMVVYTTELVLIFTNPILAFS